MPLIYNNKFQLTAFHFSREKIRTIIATGNKKPRRISGLKVWVNDGTRTRDPQNHNLMF